MSAARLALGLTGLAALAACTPRAATPAEPVPTIAPPPEVIPQTAPSPDYRPTYQPAPRFAEEDRPRAFAKCAPCHSLAPGFNGIGPSLAGVYGRKAGSEPTYRYSTALSGSGIIWDAASLDKFLTNPRAMVPLNKMAFPGLADPLARAEIIAYLQRH